MSRAESPPGCRPRGRDFPAAGPPAPEGGPQSHSRGPQPSLSPTVRHLLSHLACSFRRCPAHVPFPGVSGPDRSSCCGDWSCQSPRSKYAEGRRRSSCAPGMGSVRITSLVSTATT